MSIQNRLLPLSALALSFLTVGCAHSTPPAMSSPVLASAGALAFDEGNVLFVGDSRAGLVHAFDLSNRIEDQSEYQVGRAQTFEGRTIIDGIDRQIAALLGVDADQVLINDMVVHKASKQIFLSVHRGLGPDAEALILRVNKGRLELVDTSGAIHTAQSVGPVPDVETLEFGQPLNSLAITDIDFYHGELFVAGVSNDTFSSTLRRMNYPFEGDVKTSSIEIWHAVHAQYETRAPIITQTIAELDGDPTLIAIYACTPIVRIPLEQLKDGANVRGDMIGEMGFGNTPIDIVHYVNGWDQTQNVIVTNTNRSAVQIPLTALAGAESMPSGEGVPPNFTVSGVTQYPMPLSGTLHLDTLDEQYAVVIRRSPENVQNIQLHTLPMPFFFDRADHIVEMNWADGPDPFGYKSAPPIQFDE
ncbi:MAG: hypothetical protein AAF465_00065 [Pseudomonadota bacterium]